MGIAHGGDFSFGENMGFEGVYGIDFLNLIYIYKLLLNNKLSTLYG
jgi:hypothetical protein